MGIQSPQPNQFSQGTHPVALQLIQQAMKQRGYVRPELHQYLQGMDISSPAQELYQNGMYYI